MSFFKVSERTPNTHLYKAEIREKSYFPVNYLVFFNKKYQTGVE